MSLRSVTDGESLSGVWRWLSTNFSSSTGSLFTPADADNNKPKTLLRRILTSHKYLPEQALNPNNPSILLEKFEF